MINNTEYIKIQLNENTPKILTSYESVDKTLDNAKTSYKLDTGYLDENESKTFTLRMWIDEDTPPIDEVMNKTLSSKVTIISSYVTDYDKEVPIANFSIQKLDNKIIIDASESSDNVGIKKYYYSKDGKNFIETKESSYTFENNRINYGNGVTSLIELEENKINEVYVKVEDEYGNISEVESVAIENELLYDETMDNNLRYVGENPNNYVLFNNELWRIIGVMNNIEDSEGNIGSHLKIIRNESIGSYYWSGSSSNTSNDWTKSTLNTEILNGTYYNGLTEETKSIISNVVWNLGGISTTELLASTSYAAERGTAVYGSNPTEWIGCIGLMYPSDYGYAVGGNERNTCLETFLLNYNEECYINNFLYINNYQLTILPDGMKNYSVHIDDVGKVRINIVTRFSQFVRPTLYLNSNVEITSGLGTQENPFLLG